MKRNHHKRVSKRRDRKLMKSNFSLSSIAGLFSVSLICSSIIWAVYVFDLYRCYEGASSSEFDLDYSMCLKYNSMVVEFIGSEDNSEGIMFYISPVLAFVVVISLGVALIFESKTAKK